MRAFHFLKICADAKINVPKEVAVLGVDNDKVLCTFSNPPLSSIDTDAFALGQTAASMLKQLLSDTSRPLPAATLHKPKCIIERTTTNFYPTETPWLSDALVYIRRHIGNGISANDVIAHLGYSHTTVGKAFRKELGTSVQQEIIRYRRESACRLLKDTNMTAAQISDNCGYPSPQYFAHMFAEHFGTTPEKWRHLNKNP
jgi:LacI family transcriptional regulator